MDTEQRHSETEGRPISAKDARQAIGTGATAVDIRGDEAWLELPVPGRSTSPSRSSAISSMSFPATGRV